MRPRKDATLCLRLNREVKEKLIRDNVSLQQILDDFIDKHYKFECVCGKVVVTKVSNDKCSINKRS